MNLATGSAAYGDAEGDRFQGFENVIGSALRDQLLGDAGANTLAGGDGNDAISGGAGNDVLIGDAGDDSLSGGLGADRLEGGAGIDYAIYADAHQAVGVDLGAGKGFAGEADGDSYTSVEGVGGSNYNDVLRGDASANSSSVSLATTRSAAMPATTSSTAMPATTPSRAAPEPTISTAGPASTRSTTARPPRVVRGSPTRPVLWWGRPRRHARRLREHHRLGPGRPDRRHPAPTACSAAPATTSCSAFTVGTN